MQLSQPLISLALHSDLIRTLLNGGTLYIDNSTYESILSCQVNAFLSTVLKKRPAGPQVAFDFGTCVHGFLETYYSTKNPKASKEFALELAKNLKLDSCEDSRRNSFTLGECIDNYLMNERLNPSTVLVPYVLPDGSPFVEKSFAYELGKISISHEGLNREVTVIWTGKIDLAVSRNEGGKNYLYGVDHKTTTVMGPQFSMEKSRSSQMLGYGWALRTFITNLNLTLAFRGMLINAIALRKNGFDINQFPIPLLDWQLDDWQQETLLQLKVLFESLLLSLSTDSLVTNRLSCVTKYGPCRHLSLCTLGREAFNRMVQDRSCYVEDTWSPLKKEN